MKRYLVVANQTLGGRPLLDAVRQAASAGGAGESGEGGEEGAAFHVVVPATPPRDQLTYTEGRARALASERLEKTLARLEELGVEVTGEVGDHSPMAAIGDALREGSYDGLILSTFPPGVSRWLRQDLPHRAERTYGLPVTHVVTRPDETG
jgi:hypothetical protein